MSERSIPSSVTRRELLKLGGLGAVGLAAGGAWAASAGGSARSPARAAGPSVAAAPAASVQMALAATDGYMALPGRPAYSDADPFKRADVYIMGFVPVPYGDSASQLSKYKKAVRVPAPIISVEQEADVFVKMTNIGLEVRPDLDDSHTIHWHGFPNATAIFDGVPEVSIAVPVGRNFPYYYKPHRTGSFMYHCHFEDVEHVQMGMQGSVFVRPAGLPNQAYDDASTLFNRQFAIHLNEVWTTPHDNLESIQETVWPDYKANYWTINGRSYPDTVLPNNDPSLPFQPLSSLIQVRAGDKVLLRFSNLGFEQQSMQLPGIRMKVIGEDAARLKNGAIDLTYDTNTIYIGPGEARDVLFTAPTYNGAAALTDPLLPGKPYNRYWLRNRNVSKLTNDGATTSPGGQITEVRVYAATGSGALAAPQSHPNQTYPEPAPVNVPGTTTPYLNPWIVL